MLVHRLRRWASIKIELGQSFVFAVVRAVMWEEAWHNVALVLVHFLRRRLNIKPTLCQCLVLIGEPTIIYSLQ